MNNPTIEEAKKKKSEIETKIFSMLREFESETGVRIDGVVATFVPMYGDAEGALSSIKIKTRSL